MKAYTTKIVADWLGLTERRIRQLRDEGILEEVSPGLYDLKSCVAKYISYLGGAGKEGLNEERRRLTAAKREAAEMENAMRRRELHSAADIEKGIQTMLLNTRGRFLAMPAKLSPALAAMGGDQGQIFDALKTAIEENLEELSNYRVAFAEPEEKDNEAERGSGET